MFATSMSCVLILYDNAKNTVLATISHISVNFKNNGDHMCLSMITDAKYVTMLNANSIYPVAINESMLAPTVLQDIAL